MAATNPIVPDQGRIRTKIEEARNGIFVVNINTPNDKGYHIINMIHFNVGQRDLF